MSESQLVQYLQTLLMKRESGELTQEELAWEFKRLLKEYLGLH